MQELGSTHTAERRLDRAQDVMRGGWGGGSSRGKGTRLVSGYRLIGVVAQGGGQRT